MTLKRKIYNPQAYQYQLTISHSLEKSAALLESTNKYQLASYMDTEGLRTETNLSRLDETHYQCWIRLGGRLRLYWSTFGQAEVTGILQRVDESTTIFAYNQRILWLPILLVYGIILGIVMLLSKGTPALMLVILFMVGINVVLEVITARKYLKALTAFINDLGQN